MLPVLSGEIVECEQRLAILLETSGAGESLRRARHDNWNVLDLIEGGNDDRKLGSVLMTHLRWLTISSSVAAV